MARAADEAAWRRFRGLAEVSYGIWSEKPLPGPVCNPYFRRTMRAKKPVDTPRNQREMGRLLDELDRDFKG